VWDYWVADGYFAFGDRGCRGGKRASGWRWRREFERGGEGGGVCEGFAGMDEADSVIREVSGEMCSDKLF
jgi:hypothetical protein